MTHDDVADVTPRPLDELAAWADSANGHRDQGRFALAGRELGTLIAELHAHALTAGSADRTRAFSALVQSCIVAGDVANRIAGNADLSVSTTERAYDMACRYGDAGLIGFARWCWALQLMRLSARSRALRVLTTGIDELAPSAHLSSEDTLPEEGLGFVHLTSAQCAARDKRRDDARAHLAEAGKIAARIGECNGMGMHFGPTNVAVWQLGIGVELGEGGRAYELATRMPLDVAALNSQDRSSALHFDLARALIQDGAKHDAEVIRHLDTADRLAPSRLRNDPIARDLVLTLNRRAPRRGWELDSLLNRFGITKG